MAVIQRPSDSEFLAYFNNYIRYAPEQVDVLKWMEENAQHTVEFLSELSDEQLAFRYAPGKWTIKDILQHIIDTERIFSYRALCIARGEKQSLPGYEEDDYASAAKTAPRFIDDMLNEFQTLRYSVIGMFNSMDEEVLCKIGIVNEHPLSVRACAFILAGHEVHHIKVIQEKYLI